jgi:hypothetical protein
MTRLISTLCDAWRKNAPELRATLNGALPHFVIARHPPHRLEGVPVFAYHVVNPADLAQDLRFLRSNDYRTLSAAQFVDFLSGSYRLTGPSVLLSFDDGPRNFYTSAFPLLKRFAARAVAFVAPGMHMEAEDPDLTARPMSWREMREIHASGLVDFHSHTLESRYVAHWPRTVPLAGCDPDLELDRRGPPRNLAEDLALSRVTLQSRIQGGRSDQLAFPMYDGTAEAIEIARAIGIRACYWGLIAGRPLNRLGDSPFYVSRISHEFLRRLPGRGRMTLAQLLAARWRKVLLVQKWRRQLLPTPGRPA